MSQFWLVVILPILGGSLAIAGISLVRRYALSRLKMPAMKFLAANYSVATTLFGLIYLGTWGVTLPSLLPGFWTAIFLGAAAGLAIHYLNAKAASLDAGEVSRTAPLQAMTPGLITLLSLTLGEYPGKAGIAGVLFMIAGSYVLLWQGTPERWFDYLGPVRQLRLLFRLRHLSPAERSVTLVVAMSLGSAAMGTFGLLFDGLYVRRGQSLQGIVLASGTYVGVLAVVYSALYFVRSNKVVSQSQSQEKSGPINWRRVIWVVVAFSALLWVAHVLAIWPTFNEAFVAYVGSLKRFSVLITAVLGILFFREQDPKKRLWAAALIVVGAVLISMDGLPGRLSDRIEGFGL